MNKELETYLRQAKGYWQAFLAGPGEILDHEGRRPIPDALGIKVPSQTRLFLGLAEFFEQGDQVHVGPVNHRNIATIWRESPLADSDGQFAVRQIKLLQRRPDSQDALGLDHLDLLLPTGNDLDGLRDLLRGDGCICEIESNDAHSWLSIRFDGFEFKLVSHHVWEVCCDEARSVLA